MILHGCNGQNLTALVIKCDQDVEIWKAEAEKWHKNYIGFIICSSLVFFGSLVMFHRDGDFGKIILHMS